MASRFQDLTRPSARTSGFFWYPDPLLWRLDAVAFSLSGRSESERVEWLAVHHQILTLAQMRGANNGLWFRFSEPDGDGDRVFGALLPASGDGLDETASSGDLGSAMLVALQSSNFRLWSLAGARLPLRYWMSESRLAVEVGFGAPCVSQRIRLRKWTTSTLDNQLAPSNDFVLHRATSADYQRVLQWAAALARETHQDVEATRREALELVRTGGLVVASTKSQDKSQDNFPDNSSQQLEPIGMFAFSGVLALEGVSPLTRISMVFIDPKHRRQGLGTAMLQAAVQEIALENTGHCVLFADSDNKETAQFYEHVGFTGCGTWVKVKTTGK